MARQLRAFAALSEDLSSLLSTHIAQLMSIRNANPTSLGTYTHVEACAPAPAHIHKTKTQVSTNSYFTIYFDKELEDQSSTRQGQSPLKSSSHCLQRTFTRSKHQTSLSLEKIR